jgi:hypothetical protein
MVAQASANGGTGFSKWWRRLQQMVAQASANGGTGFSKWWHRLQQMVAQRGFAAND